ncbi:MULTISPECIES: DUF5712 family protein [unclassified Flavobacterium]|uniref:DUF5712 family protein n=1 Tax=unclassified Flavobacterium TaxID=196869 RepID=UPI00131B070E|nr:MULTISPECIES: DUF5712 family protein [unclassified Flavobacterium]
MPISKPHSSLGADNKGSCSNLAIYLGKENEELDKIIKKSLSRNDVFQLERRKQGFFTSSETNVSAIEVISSIDKNKRKLGANDAKYFAPTISFSDNELNHIAFLATGKTDLTNVWDFNAVELEQFNTLIRAYGRKVMDNYALNFNRQQKGINAGSDLVYFAKIEHFRKFKGTDKDVLNGKRISGENKEGLQSHIHFIVSRKDKSQRLKLNPICNEKNTNRTIGDNEYQVGFDRVNWIKINEETFDEHFRYNRKLLEKFENQNILKNGSPQEKHELNKKIAASNTKTMPIIESQMKSNITSVSSAGNNLMAGNQYQNHSIGILKGIIAVIDVTNSNDISISDDKKKKLKTKRSI